MSEQNLEWWSIKIFSKEGYSVNDCTQRIWALRDLLLPKLEKLGSENFFIHYSDPETYKEGPHFKFFVKTTEKRITNFKNDFAENSKIDKIEISSEEHSQDIEQGIKAKDIFEKIKEIPKTDILKLQDILSDSKEYKELSEKGKHYLHNMFQLSIIEEKQFQSLLS